METRIRMRFRLTVVVRLAWAKGVILVVKAGPLPWVALRRVWALRVVCLVAVGSDNLHPDNKTRAVEEPQHPFIIGNLGPTARTLCLLQCLTSMQSGYASPGLGSRFCA
ncbi:hypothetical protein NDU88_004637 [Pleurodeles waltl]|uniref:Secreted protein n=1 Tax=Pleurodeles waltl TaxID=8319 RepID=A0AAV7QCK6_PLEWA|nr:hypothetical protein NDU88_004637 [Pleurodeles waltl]